MLPRRGHRSAGPRRAADWPPPGSRTLTTLPLLVMMMVMLSSVCAAEDEPRLLGCLTASLDQLLRRAAFSTPADTAAHCFRICGQQEAPLTAVGQRWCFCLDQQLGAEEMDADCSSPPPDGQQLVRVHALEKLADLTEADEVHQAQAPAEPSNPLSSLSQSLMVGTLHLEPVRCAATITEYNDTPKQVDMCVHTCSTQFSTGFVAMGPSMGSSEQYECHCTADDEFGASLSDDTCNQPCMRFGEELHDTLCGGFTANGSTALSVYRLVDDEPGSTPTPVTTRRSTGHSAPASGITDSACPDGGVQVDDRGCYRPEAVTGDITRPDDPRTYDEAVEACDRLSNSGWRPWAIETQEERDRVFQVLLIEMGFLQDTDDVVTSGTVQADGSTVRWADWPGDPDADWLDGLTSGTPQPGYVLVWGNIQGPSAASTTLQYYKPDELPNPLAVICELPLAGTTAATTTETTTPTPTSTEPTTTETTTPIPTSTEPTTTPDVTSPSTTTSLPSTHKPRPVTPDDVINDLIDNLNGTTASNVTESDVIDTVDQLDDILAAQVNMSSHLPPPERLESDMQFTIDMVQLVDTLLSATDAWSSMTQDQLEETSSQLMSNTEATGFLLAASAAAAGSSDVIEAVQPRLVLSASAVDRHQSGAGFRFPSESADASSWIELPEGYLDQETDPDPDSAQHPEPDPDPRPDPESDWVQQVGVLYRTELMERILSPSNNSMDDAGKRLNSEVLSFSLGSAAGRVPLAGAGARLHMGYALVEREPAQREVWRHLHAGEEPSAVRGSAVCTYWNYTHSQWTTDGCHLESSSSSKHHATCVCTHLTSFSILMDYHDYVGTPESLNILTWVLGSLSLVGLVITWIVFTCNRSLRCTRTTITRNLCGTYAIGLLLLLTVMDRRLVYLAPGACTVAGMAIHYSFLAVFAWTMVEGIHLYKVLRHVFEPKSNSMTRYYMYGYLVPALIIIATNTVALAVDQYAYVRDEFCWLTIPYFIWFYNGPIGVVLILNMFVLILAYRSAASLKVNQLRAKSEKMKRWLKGWFSLSCLLGVQWAIGYIYVDGSNFFDYVFTALNCSQGLLIFIFHCVLREKTRQILLGRFSTNKRSTMMNSVYGQMVIAERKKQEYRQSRMSHDTCVTQLSNSPSPANSESPDSSPASERSSSSSQGSGSSKASSAGSGSRKGRPSLTRGVSADSRCTNSSLRGRVNLAFQPDEPWAPLPDISEETDGVGSPRRGPGPAPVPGRGSRGAHPPPARHPALAEMYRSHSVAALRHGKAH